MAEPRKEEKKPKAPSHIWWEPGEADPNMAEIIFYALLVCTTHRGRVRGCRDGRSGSRALDKSFQPLVTRTTHILIERAFGVAKGVSAQRESSEPK